MAAAEGSSAISMGMSHQSPTKAVEKQPQNLTPGVQRSTFNFTTKCMDTIQGYKCWILRDGRLAQGMGAGR